MKELEKQQKESDDSADRHYDMYAPGNGVAVPNSGVGGKIITVKVPVKFNQFSKWCYKL